MAGKLKPKAQWYAVITCACRWRCAACRDHRNKNSNLGEGHRAERLRSEYAIEWQCHRCDSVTCYSVTGDSVTGDSVTGDSVTSARPQRSTVWPRAQPFPHGSWRQRPRDRWILDRIAILLL